jgi:eukaryotic-like serine/threonine-protein kinase
MFETLGIYKVLDRIGTGSIGDVYRARDTRLGRTVAIKVVKAEIAGDPVRRARFLQDARAATALSHPSIAALYEIGEDQDQLFLAFEFVPGETLHAVMDGRPMNPKRALEFATQMADALADAHAADFVHGDLTSDQVIVTPKGRVKILDFGFSAWTDADARRGDHQSDICSLGMLLFEMLTGRLPTAEPTVQAPSSLNAAVPRELDPIVERMLAKRFDQQYESVATVAAELRSVGAMLDERAAAAELRAPSPAVAARSRGLAPWIVLLAIIVAALLAWLYVRS